MLMNAAEFLIRKAFEAKYKGRKVDRQIASCYTDFIMNGSLIEDSLQDFKEMLNQMLSAVNLFDKNGKPENMYVSLCMVFDKVLTKEEYYRHADRLLKNIVAYSELSTYLDYSAFKNNIMSDFDLRKIDFPKTNTMIYKDAKLLSKYLNTTYIKTKGGIVHDVTTSRVIHKASKYADLTKPIYAYTIDPHLNVKLIPDKDVDINIEEDSITVMISSRCSISFSNYPLTPKK